MHLKQRVRSLLLMSICGRVFDHSFEIVEELKSNYIILVVTKTLFLEQVIKASLYMQHKIFLKKIRIEKKMLYLNMGF